MSALGLNAGHNCLTLGLDDILARVAGYGHLSGVILTLLASKSSTRIDRNSRVLTGYLTLGEAIFSVASCTTQILI